ncbi:MAG TPA: T9SS type A sorting domain-containing protein, partial [Bacteroidales bacterium]|nr:T9SS type A sorting domain-containing protein [Bacteroidales bacterium]
SWYDQFIMKSNDNGATWTKTVIWPCPYNFWAGGDTTGIFYCPDGASAVALDKNGKAHVLFGLQRGMGDETGSKYWYPFTDGLIYWNEDKPELPEVLDPDWLDENGYVIGWVQDTMVWHAETTALAYYYNSMSSMPQLAFDDQNNAVAVWSSVTTLTDPNSFMLRHVFARKSQDGGATWNSDIIDLNSDLLYTWSECVYPSLSPTSNYFWHILFQADDYAGSYVQAPTQGQTDITENSMTYLKFSKWMNGINDPCGQDLGGLRVSPVFPNPASANAFLNLDVTNSQRIRIELTSITGQVVREYQPGTLTAGVHRVKLDLTGLQPGIYQYTVIANTGKASGKVIKTQE